MARVLPALPLASGFRAIARCSVALALAWSASCGDAVEDRLEQGDAVSTARFGELGRLRVQVEPGRIARVEDDDGYSVTVRAAAPFPGLVLANGTDRSTRMRVRLDNVPLGARLLPALGPLSEGARRSPSCVTTPGPGAEVLLAPIAPEQEPPASLEFEVLIPRCARVAVTVALPEDTSAYTIAVIAPLDARSALIERAFAAAVRDGADHVHFLGDVGDPRRADPFASVFTHGEASGLTFGASIGRDEQRDGGSVFSEYFGPSDFVVQVGGARFAVLDTGSGRLTDGQFAMIEALEADVPGVVATYMAPLGTGVTPTLRSEAQGARLVNALTERGFVALFAGGGVRPSAQTFGGLAIHDLGSAPSDAGPSIALVTVVDPLGVDGAGDPPVIEVRTTGL